MHDIKDILFRLSAVIILFSAALYLFAPAIAPWTMAFAVALFSAITATHPYPGKSTRGKRLFTFQVFSCVLMVVATYLMFRQRNEWVLVMISGAVFLFYAAIVIPKELEKENKEL
jgi:hypothetical protein